MPADTNKLTKRTYFGVVSLVIAILSIIFLAAYFGVSQLNISTVTFSLWNKVTALVYCLVTPTAMVFAIFAWRRKEDSRTLAAIAVAIIGLPFVFLFLQFVMALLP